MNLHGGCFDGCKYTSDEKLISWYDGYSTLNNAIDCKSEAHQQGKYSFRIKGEAG